MTSMLACNSQDNAAGHSGTGVPAWLPLELTTPRLSGRGVCVFGFLHVPARAGRH